MNVLASKFSGKSLLSPRRLCSTIYNGFDPFPKIYAQYKLDTPVIRIIARYNFFKSNCCSRRILLRHCDLHPRREIFKDRTNESSMEIKLPKKIFLREEA